MDLDNDFGRRVDFYRLRIDGVFQKVRPSGEVWSDVHCCWEPLLASAEAELMIEKALHRLADRRVRELEHRLSIFRELRELRR